MTKPFYRFGLFRGRTMLTSLLLYLLCLSRGAWAQDPVPFGCTSMSFQFEGEPTKVQVVNLATGDVTEVASGITSGTEVINGVGYNSTDGLIYGFLQGDGRPNRLVQVDANYNVVEFPSVNIYSNTGDISSAGLMYYKISATLDLGVLDLAEGSPTRLQVIDTIPFGLPDYFDIGINSVDGNIYAVDKAGANNAPVTLYRLNPVTEQLDTLGEVSATDINQNGNIGAAWFASDGNMYVIHNNNGNVYRIGRPDTMTVNIPRMANIFAEAESASQNDGARCADAPLADAVKADLMITQPSCEMMSLGSITFTNPMNASQDNYDYSIDSASTWSMDSVFTNLPPGTYFPFIRDADDTSNVSKLPPVVLMVDPEEQPFAGDDGMLMLCEDDDLSSIDLEGVLEGTPDTGGVWTEISGVSSGVSLSDPSSVDFSSVDVGTYVFQYIVTGPVPCEADTALATIGIKAGADAGENGVLMLCAEEDNSSVDIAGALMGTPDAGGVWTEISGVSSGVNLSNPNAVDFSSADTGTYIFQYLVSAEAPCQSDSAMVTVMLEACDTCIHYVIDFEEFSAGDIPMVFENGAMSTDDPVNHPLMIFDSSNPTGGDFDLGTPNEDFSGPGVGSDGESGEPGENSIPLGNILIISDDGNSGNPNDFSGGGLFRFDFDFLVRVDTIIIIDVEPDEMMVVTMFDSLGGVLSTFDVGGLGNNSYQELPINTDNVKRFLIEFVGSGSVGEVRYSICSDRCTNAIAGQGGTTMICEGDTELINLNELLTDNPDIGGVWTEESLVSSGVDLSNPLEVDFSAVPPGTYIFQYLVEAIAPCTSDSTEVTVIVMPGGDAGTDGSLELCEDDDLSSIDLAGALGGTPDTGGVWMETSNPMSGVNLSDPSMVDFSSVDAGNYTFKYVVGNECGTDTAMVMVEIDEGVDAGTDGSLELCEDDDLSSIDLAGALGGTPDAGGVWMETSNPSSGVNLSDPTMVDFSGVDAGSYTFKYVVGDSASACGTDTSMVMFEIDEGVDAGTDGMLDLCADDDLSSIDLAGALGGTPDAGGVWMETSNPSSGVNLSDPTMVDFSGVDAGSYTFKYVVGDSASACGTDTVMVMVEIDEGVDAGTDGSLELCADDDLSSIDLAGALGGTPDAGGVWMDTSNPSSGVNLSDPTMVDFSGVDAGSYTFKYVVGTVESACGTDTAMVMVEIEEGVDAGTDGSLELCADDDLSSIDLVGALGGTPDAGGVWMETSNPSSGVNLSDPTMVDFSGVDAGSYTFKYVVGTLESACGTDTAMVMVEIDEGVDAGTDGSLELCADDDLSSIDLAGALGGTPDAGGVWMETSNPSSGVNLSDPTMVDFSGVDAGSYTFKYVVGTLESACGTDTAMVMVEIDEGVDAGTDGMLDLCADNDLSSIDLAGALGGTPDAGGVWMDTSNPSSGVNLSDPTMVDFSGVDAGSYTFKYVVGTLESACGTDTAMVMVEIDEGVDAGTDGMLDLCADDDLSSIDLAGALGGTPDAGGVWMETSNPSSGVNLSDPTMVDFSGVDAGSYTFKYVVGNVMSSCGTDTAMVTVSINQIELEKEKEDASCNEDDGSISLMISGGTMPYDIQWSGPDNFFSNAPEIDGLAPGDYIVKVTDANGCMAIDTCTIEEDDEITGMVWKKPAHCGWFDGKICFKNVEGCNVKYFEYSIDGGKTWSHDRCFGWLDGGIYHPLIRDKYNPDNVLDLGEMELENISDLSAWVKVKDATCYEAGKIIIHDRKGGSGWYMYSYDGGDTWEWNSSKYWVEPGKYHVLMRDGQSYGCILDLGYVEVGNGCEPNGNECELYAKVHVTNAGCDWGSISIYDQKGGAGWYMYSIDGGQSWNYNGYQGWLAPGTYHVMICDGENTSCHYDLGTYVVEDDGCQNPYTWRTNGKAVTEEPAVYPNPVSEEGVINVEMPEGKEQVDYRLVDFNGKVMVEGASSASSFSLSLQGLAKGQYLLELKDEDGKITVKQVIVR